MSMLEQSAVRSGAETGPVVTVSTDAIPPSDPFGWWNDMVGQEVMPVTTSSPHAPHFQGWVEAVQLPHGRMGTFTYSPMKARRSPVQIRRQDPEHYFLVLVGHSTSIRLEQGRNTTCLDPGGMALFSTSHPLACDFVDQGAPCQTTQLLVPRAVLGDRADRLLAEPLSTRTGSGALLVPYLTGLVQAARGCGPAELARLGAIGTDLAASLLAAHLGETDRLPSETRRTVLLARINAFIDENLSDPELRPATTAAYHHISLRTLHQLFRSEPQSVAATIRSRRLSHCRSDLLDPALSHLPIAETAARWGFPHQADLSRAFRRVYGVPPRELRAAARNAKNTRTLS